MTMPESTSEIEEPVGTLTWKYFDYWCDLSVQSTIFLSSFW